MRKTLSYILYTLLLAVVACACSDDIDIRQSYEFEVTHLPVPKKLKVGETAEIRCQIERSGNYENTIYRFRYFQSDGYGILRMNDSEVFKPNDYYDLTEESFRFYYTSQSNEQQVIDIYFFDNFGNTNTLSFTFNHNSDREEKE